MKKEDLRVVVTKKIIRSTLLELLEEKDISLISIKELTETAGINRGTFYKHYNHVVDVASEMINDIATLNLEKWATCTALEYDQIRERFVVCFKILNEYKHGIQLLNRNYGSVFHHEGSLCKAKPIFFNLYKKAIGNDITDNDLDILFNYAFVGTLNMVRDWLYDVEGFTIDQMADRATDITLLLVDYFKVKYSSNRTN